jgi:hypothetical protein
MPKPSEGGGDGRSLSHPASPPLSKLLCLAICEMSVHDMSDCDSSRIPNEASRLAILIGVLVVEPRINRSVSYVAFGQSPGPILSSLALGDWGEGRSPSKHRSLGYPRYRRNPLHSDAVVVFLCNK